MSWFLSCPRRAALRLGRTRDRHALRQSEYAFDPKSAGTKLASWGGPDERTDGNYQGLLARRVCLVSIPSGCFIRQRPGRLDGGAKEEARDIVARHFSRFLDRCGVTVSVDGAFPEPGKGCVLCYNETSFVDVAAYSVAMWPHVDRAAAADLYAYVPGGRAACRKAAIELVPRGNRPGTDRLLDRMVTVVKQGKRVAWGGEGRLSGMDGFGRFKLGASLIAIRALVPVIPVIFHGGHNVMPLGSLRARPGEVWIRFCASVSTLGYKDADAREFANGLQRIAARTYHQLADRLPMIL